MNRFKKAIEKIAAMCGGGYKKKKKAMKKMATAVGALPGHDVKPLGSIDPRFKALLAPKRESGKTALAAMISKCPKCGCASSRMGRCTKCGCKV